MFIFWLSAGRCPQSCVGPPAQRGEGAGCTPRPRPLRSPLAPGRGPGLAPGPCAQGRKAAHQRPAPGPAALPAGRSPSEQGQVSDPKAAETWWPITGLLGLPHLQNGNSKLSASLSGACWEHRQRTGGMVCMAFPLGLARLGLS